MSQPKIVQHDPQTEALKLRSGPEHSEIHLGSITDAHLFLHYNGSKYVGYSYWNSNMYGQNGVLLSERASGIPLHTTLELLCYGKLNLDVTEAFFERRGCASGLIRWGEVYHVKRLKLYALPDALLLLPGV